MTDAPTRRLPGRKLVAVFLGILAAVIGTTIVLFLRAGVPSGEILALTAEGDRSALLLREAEGTKKRHVQLVRFLDDGTQPHKISLFAVQPGATPFVIGDRVLVEAMTARGYPTVQAFDVKDLSFAYWAPEPAKTLEDGAVGATLAASRGGRPVVVSVHRGAPGELLVFDAGDGEELLRVPLEGVASPARLTLLEDEAVTIGLEGGRELTLDLRDGGEREAGEPVPAEARCVIAGGQVVRDDRALGAAPARADALLDLEDGCLVRRGERFELRTPLGVRAFEITGAPIAPSEAAHVAGGTLFLLVDEREVVALDLRSLALAPEPRGLSVRELPPED